MDEVLAILSQTADGVYAIDQGQRISQPDRFDITRGVTPQQHTAFAVGPHYCLGAPLARLEGVAFTTLFQRFNTFALAVDKPVYKPMVIARALERLPVVMA